MCKNATLKYGIMGKRLTVKPHKLARKRFRMFVFNTNHIVVYDLACRFRSFNWLNVMLMFYKSGQTVLESISGLLSTVIQLLHLKLFTFQPCRQWYKMFVDLLFMPNVDYLSSDNEKRHLTKNGHHLNCTCNAAWEEVN